MLNLYLLRHAKSSWADLIADDFDRPLSPRGRRAARRIAEYICEQGIRPDLILCSPAQRARQTLKALSLDTLAGAQILFEEGLYGGSPSSHLALINLHSHNFDEVLAIGHNPALEALASLLVGSGDKTPRTALAKKYPTGALAHIAFDLASWSMVAPGSGRLVAFTRPRDLARVTLSDARPN